MVNREKRHYPRLHFLGSPRPPLQIHTPTGQTFSAEIRNISTGGLCLDLIDNLTAIPQNGDILFLTSRGFLKEETPMTVCYTFHSKGIGKRLIGLNFHSGGLGQTL